MTWPTLQAFEERLSAWYLRRCQNIADLRRVAHWRVPAPMFHYMDGAAEDEVTYRRNASDFDALELLPRSLIDISNIDPSTTVMGQRIEMPVILLIQPNANKGRHIQPQGRRIYQRNILRDDLICLQLTHPTQAWAGGKPDLIGQFLIGDAPIDLNGIQNLTINGV